MNYIKITFVSLSILNSLFLMSCKFEGNTEFTIYAQDSQAESAEPPHIESASIKPDSSSISIHVNAHAGSSSETSDAAFMRIGLVRIDNSSWDTLQLITDSLNAGSYPFQGSFQRNSTHDSLLIDIIVIDQFGRSDSLMQKTIPPSGREFYYNYSCGNNEGCLVQRDL